MKLKNGQEVNRETIEQFGTELADLIASTIGTQAAPDFYEIRRYTDFRVNTVAEYAVRYDFDATSWFDQAYADRIAEVTADLYI